MLNISGQVTENLYQGSWISGAERNSDSFYNNPAINEWTITKNEVRYLSAGEEYSFSVLPTEVVTINIRSFDENDVKISAFNNGRERTYIIEGTNKLGLFLSFQNR